MIKDIVQNEGLACGKLNPLSSPLLLGMEEGYGSQKGRKAKEKKIRVRQMISVVK